ncbi:MAG: hypothetical protein QNJ63_13035 [Calothrix sp. MO_192.B10]|nr:hypothetical protein [Calothrix sp. MO_192.B10]
MKEFQQNNRTTAAKNFLHSLNQLEQIIQEDGNQEEDIEQGVEEQTNNQAKQPSISKKSSEIDITVWEEAVADIEQYLQEKDQ